MSNVGVIGDPHEPVSHPGYLKFCQDVFKRHKCKKTVCIGDIADHQAISFHAANPMCPGPDDELDLTIAAFKKWHKAFPDLIVTIGNHDQRVLRIAESNNIPARFVRDFNDVYKTPGWKWVHDIKIDDVYYFHGTGRGGINPAFNVMKDMGMSVVMGHCHSVAGVKWSASPYDRRFGMDVGCGIDVRAYQFAYGKHIKKRPILGCGVVLNSVPHYEIMPCANGERYHHSRFEKNLDPRTKKYREKIYGG